MVGWDPKGEYRVQRGASLTSTSAGPTSGSGSSGSSSEFYQFKYNFQPESVDKSRPGGLVGNGETYELEFSGNGGASSSSNIDQSHGQNSSINVVNGGGNAGGETFSWSSTERQGRLVDCLLIFDEETQTFTLERQHSAFTFIQNRRNKESKTQVLHLPNSKHDPHATVTSPVSNSLVSTPVLPVRQGNGKIEGRGIGSTSGSNATVSAALTAAALSSATTPSGAHRNGHIKPGGDVRASQDQEDDTFNDDDLLMDIENAINDFGDMQGDDGDDEDDIEDEEMEEVLTPVILPAAMPPAQFSAPTSYPTTPSSKSINSSNSRDPLGNMTRKPLVEMPKTPAERAAAFGKPGVDGVPNKASPPSMTGGKTSRPRKVSSSGTVGEPGFGSGGGGGGHMTSSANNTPKLPSVPRISKSGGGSASVGGTPKSGLVLPTLMSPQERLLKQQQQQQQQQEQQQHTTVSRARQPSSPGGDTEAHSEDDDLVDFLEGQMMTVAGGKVNHDDEGDITSSDEDD
ncbi:MAG: hypothetical protein J3R72DRAFT_427818 [Linnemannia gamsii]|nr:MAG: hypothetical protein J3R72DRAFT_427818 [Linnemannia gamsii]